jgi:hypothetical protein
MAFLEERKGWYRVIFTFKGIGSPKPSAPRIGESPMQSAVQLIERR